MRKFRPVFGAPSSQHSVSVITYNLLANRFALSGKHDYCGREFLEWGRRGNRLLEEILAYSADILCLQEVERKMYREHWEPLLQRHGYESIYYSRESPEGEAAVGSGEEVEGCALLYRASRFICRDLKAARFADLIPASAPSSDFMDKARSLNEGAAAALLACRGCGTELIAVSTHIHYDPKWPDVKAYQSSLLTQVVSKMVDVRAHTPIVIGGDFNSLWRKYYSDEFDTVPEGQEYLVSGAYQLLSDGELSADHPHHPNQRHAGLPAMSLTSHNLSLTSVHYKAVGREPPLTTKTNRFAGCLDYVFVSDSCQVLGVLEMPYGDQPDAVDTEGSNIEFGPIPNADFGSDHLAVGCQLLLCKPRSDMNCAEATE